MMNPIKNLFKRQTHEPISDQRLDDVLCVVASRRRRHVIETVHSDRTISFSAVVDAVAHAESGPDVSSTERNRVYTSLYQTHVPELSRHDIIEYDPEAGQITATSELDALHAATTAFATTWRD